MARNVRTYDHFCLLARALERLGDRWSLLVIRDLLSGPKRFTDLMDRLGGITPKTLTQRLRELTDGGIVDADRQAGRREVWYRLTPAGEDLGPAVEALSWWGWEHAWRPPGPGEALHGEHLLRALVMFLDHTATDRGPALWHMHFVDDGDYAIASDGSRWTLSAGAPAASPDVAVTGATSACAQFVIDPSSRRAKELGITVTGERSEIVRFQGLARAFSQAARSPAHN